MWDILTLIGIVVGGVICYALVAGFAFSVWYRPIKNARRHLTITDFQKEFEGSSYRREAVQFAYEDLTNVAGHPIFRSDHLWNTFHLDPDEVDDAIDKRLKELGIDNVSWTSPIDTVEDYVRFWSYVVDSVRGTPAQPSDKGSAMLMSK